MPSIKSKLKMLAKRQLRYANNLIKVNAEIENLLKEENIKNQNLNCIYLLSEPSILYNHLIEIADNYQNKKNFKLEIIKPDIKTESKFNIRGW